MKFSLNVISRIKLNNPKMYLLKLKSSSKNENNFVSAN